MNSDRFASPVSPRRARIGERLRRVVPDKRRMSRGLMATCLLALALISLFTSFKMQLGGAQLRPFDALAVLLIATVLLRRDALVKGFPLGFLLLLPFMAWHVISALALGIDNGVREGVQIATVSLFALSVGAARDRLNYHLLGMLLLIGLAAVMVINIGWHITHGFPVGWKRLNDPKATFTFLPLALACALVLTQGSRRRLFWLLWAVLGAAVFLSGERKALIAYGVLTGAILSQGRLPTMVPIAIGGFLVLQIFASVVDDPYLSRQLQTLVGGGEHETFVVDGMQVESLSNAQREFTFKISKQLITQHPIVGIGTNAFGIMMRRNFSAYPTFMQLPFHGEFIRILTENGVIGLGLYLSIWIAAFSRMRSALRQAARVGALKLNQARILPYIFFTPALMYVGFEAAGTRCFVVLITISLVADLLPHALQQRREDGGRAAASTPPGQRRLRSETTLSPQPRN